MFIGCDFDCKVNILSVIRNVCKTFKWGNFPVHSFVFLFRSMFHCKIAIDVLFTVMRQSLTISHKNNYLVSIYFVGNKKHECNFRRKHKLLKDRDIHGSFDLLRITYHQLFIRDSLALLTCWMNQLTKFHEGTNTILQQIFGLQ